jgi:TPR repeat protein
LGERIILRLLLFFPVAVFCATIGWALFRQPPPVVTPAFFDEIFSSAEAGNADAQFTLSSLYRVGQRIPKDTAEAAKWLKRAAELGSLPAQYDYARMSANGVSGVPLNEAEAEKWYKTAFDRYKKAAEQGDADAQYRVGAMYGNGLGVAANGTEAVKWLTKAAGQGNADAAFQLSDIYREGKRVRANKTQAATWLKTAVDLRRGAAEKGSAFAKFRLGDFFYYGDKSRGFGADRVEAEKWYKMAAEQFREAAAQGDSQAQYYLGQLYANGRGVLKDATEAAKWYQMAAEQGHIGSMSRLIGLYSSGNGVLEDEAEEAKWRETSAAQRRAYARKVSGGGLEVTYYSGMIWVFSGLLLLSLLISLTLSWMIKKRGIPF